MIQIVRYVRNTGEIVSTIKSPDSNALELYKNATMDAIVSNQEITFPCAYFVNNGEVAIRPLNPATISALTLLADSIDSITISSLPNPCSVTVDDATYEVTDGSFEFSTTMPGAYSVVVESFPYKPTTFEVTAI